MEGLVGRCGHGRYCFSLFDEKRSFPLRIFKSLIILKRKKKH